MRKTCFPKHGMLLSWTEQRQLAAKLRKELPSLGWFLLRGLSQSIERKLSDVIFLTSTCT